MAAADTALFRDLPRVAAEVRTAPWLGTDRGVRRYGFHGLAHEAMLRGWCALHPELEHGGRLITTRSGDVEPMVVAYLQRKKNLSAEQVIQQLNEPAGGQCAAAFATRWLRPVRTFHDAFARRSGYALAWHQIPGLAHER